jgi:glycosyltransferase involved in cell wall biosynthesis
MDVGVIVQVYNEEANVRLIYDRIKNNRITSEIFLLDDGYADLTPKIMREVLIDPIVQVIRNSTNLGNVLHCPPE